MERVLGIDLGTTYSCVAVVESETPLVIANKGGYRTTPSIVAFTAGGRRLVGHLAKRQAVTNPKNTVYAVKRIIGRSWNSDIVQKMAGLVPYDLVEGPHNDPRIEVQGKSYGSAEISAMVLVEMKRVAEEYFNAPITKAVITVPAYFNDGQRHATKDSGRIAGLDVLRIINEPTAAALSYGFRKDIEKKVAVFDLGGGTFDISIMDINRGVFKVLASAGDSFLGGEDFDQRIVSWIVQAFSQDTKFDPREDPMALQRIKDAAEKAKCELSFQNETEVNLPFLYSLGKNKALHFQRKLSRGELEQMTLDLVERTIAICESTLKDAQLKPKDISEVILVGGQSRMPKVQELVKRYFGREPSKNVHPDEVVALGAAIQGFALATEPTGKPKKTLLMDVTPHSLGIMIVGGYFQTLIEKNTTVPTSANHVFTTVKDNQTSVKIMVFQGESRVASDNELLGEFVLTGLREASRGEVHVDVNFDISADGIVSVSAKDLETNRRQSIIVTASSSLTEEEIVQMKEEAQDYMLQEVEDTQVEKLKSKIGGLMGEIERLCPALEESQVGSVFATDLIAKARSACESARRSLAKRGTEELLVAAEVLDRTLGMLRNLSRSTPAPRKH